MLLRSPERNNRASFSASRLSVLRLCQPIPWAHAKGKSPSIRSPRLATAAPAQNPSAPLHNTSSAGIPPLPQFANQLLDRVQVVRNPLQKYMVRAIPSATATAMVSLWTSRPTCRMLAARVVAGSFKVLLDQSSPPLWLGCLRVATHAFCPPPPLFLLVSPSSCSHHD